MVELRVVHFLFHRADTLYYQLSLVTIPQETDPLSLQAKRSKSVQSVAFPVWPYAQ